MKKKMYMFIISLLSLLLTGCGGGGSEDSIGLDNSTESNGTIGISVLTLGNPFFNVIAEGVREEAAKNGYDVIVVDGDRDVQKQANQIDDFLTKGVDAIILNPCDRQSIGPAIEKANKAGVPVFTCDLKCVAEGAEVVSHVGSDNLQGGRLAGEAMIEALGEQGGQVLVVHFPQANSCQLRVQGFEEIIGKYNAGLSANLIEVVAQLDGGGVRDEGYKVTEDTLQAFPDLRGIFAINDPSGLGARAALEKAGKQDQVSIVAFDGQPEGKQAIKDGKIFADPVQFPELIGKKTVELIMEYFAGNEVEKEVLIPTKLYRQEDGLNDPSLKDTEDLSVLEKSTEKKGTIGISVLTLGNPFFNVIAEGVREEAAKNGYDVIVVDGDRDVQKQANQIDDFLTKGVDAIILNPCDRYSIGSAIKKANKSGVPVFTCDLKCVAEGAEVVSHVGSDNLQGGRLAGEAMIEALGGEGGEILVVHFPQANSCQLRVKGFEEVIGKYNAGLSTNLIKVVAQLDGGGVRDEGYKVTEDTLQAYPDLRGIFAINDPSGLGARAALEKAGKQDQVTIVAFDGQPEGKQAIKDGKIFADPIQFPDLIGKKTVELIMEYFAGNEVEKEVLIPTKLYRQADGVQDPSLK